ncbi:MAG: AAA family ATPase [Actinomycetota bacterium]|nr:AAA family ATPase [Actinomycetota bacterium]
MGLSGADLASVVNEAALLAARAGRQTISQTELDAALARVMEAPERQRRLSMRGRSFVRWTGSTDDRVTFADVAGVDEVLGELAEIKEYLTEPERFVDMGARPPKGLLLSGPPGCGKTLLGRALATETNAAFFPVASTEFVEVFVGEGAARVRDLFAEARSVAPAIVFLDEIDAIGAHRGVSIDGQREREQTLNQILVELDGFEPRAGVIVVAATNRPEILDPALIRPGRFDRNIALGLPDRTARARILAVHARGKRLAPDVDLDAVAAMTQGYSGADLANVLNEAALLAARRRLETIPMAVVEEAVDRSATGLAATRHMAPGERKAVAYHEAGHALVGRALPGALLPRKVSIVARTHSLGGTWMGDTEDRSILPKSALIDRMAATLAGRVAEELVFGQPLTGAEDDLRRATAAARAMVCELGMGESLGPLAFPEANAAAGPVVPYSDETARTIDAEVQHLVQEAMERARGVLAGDRSSLDLVARALFDNETITDVELERLLVAAPSRVSSRRQVVGGGS